MISVAESELVSIQANGEELAWPMEAVKNESLVLSSFQALAARSLT